MLLALAIAGLFVLPQPWSVVALVVAAFVEVGEVYFWIRFLRRYRVTTGAEGLVGERVEVIERCDPVGRAKVRGEIWTARSGQALAAGARARIAAVDGLTLMLEPDGSPAYGKGPRTGPFVPKGRTASDSRRWLVGPSSC